MSGDLPPPPSAPSDGSRTDASSARGYERVPPHSLDAEVSVLGAALLSPTAASEIIQTLGPGHFYRNAHRIVFEGIQALVDANGSVDTVTLTDWLARRDRLDEVGGATAIHDLTVAVPTAANANYYARIVRDRALLRRLIDAGTKVAQLGYESTDDVDSVVDRAESLIFDVAQTGATSEYARLGELLNDSFEQIERLAEQKSEVTGLATGFDDLDRLTAGLQPQNLIIIAARPSMGKCLSGCRVNYLKTGEWVEIGELVRRGRGGEPINIAALDEVGRLVPVDVSGFHDNGVQPVYRLRTRSGRQVKATASHPFLTWSGWRELHQLQPGDVVAAPRRLPYFGDAEIPDAEVKLLAHLIAAGCLRKPAPELITESAAIEAEASECAATFGARVSVVTTQGTSARTLAFRSARDGAARETVAEAAGVDARRVAQVPDGHQRVPDAVVDGVRTAVAELGSTGRHPESRLREWLAELGLAGCAAHDRFVPGIVFTLPRQQTALFLSRLFATDGSAWVAEEHGHVGISYSSVSERLIRDVQHLLLRFGILSRIRERPVGYLDGANRTYELEIRDASNVGRFLSEIGIFSKEGQCARVRDAVDPRGGNPGGQVDLLPLEAWDLILAEKGDRSWAEVSEATGRPRSHEWHVGRRRPSRGLMAELAEALDSQPLRDLATSDVLWDEIVAIEPAGEERVYDLTVPGLHNFVADDLIVHNSSLCLGVAQFVSVRLKRPSIVFSLEMSKIEIVNRLLSSEARIDSARLRTGRLEDTDWRKLGDALGTLSEAPLFIDDTPSISLMEIRAKARRLKQKHGLDLIIVDYLQLMQSHRRVDSRQQEVAEISRGLKMLAKELDVPVMALSQLSRQPETRTDKRPQLADLRESGCLTRATRLFRADTGQPVTFGELLDRDLRDVPVWATDDEGRVVAARLTHAFPSGTKPVFRVRLRSGRTVEASANHPFRTLDGWSPLEDLEAGSRVAAARRLPEPSEPDALDQDELTLLAHLVGQGTTVARQPIRYTSADEANVAAVEKAALTRFGVRARRVPDATSATTTRLYLPAPHRLTHGRRNPIAAWLDTLGLWDRPAHEKRIPPVVFGLGDSQLRWFLHHLWATDGCVHVGTGRRGSDAVSVHYATSSAELARDLQLLLLRFGLRSRIRRTASGSGRDGWQVWLEGAEQQRRFLSQIGVHGARAEAVDRALAALGATGRVQPSEDDLFWDEIVAIDAVGEQEVFDATVAERHNFVAEGLVLHNSIEQDADIVGFIYRDEVYDEDSPDKGIAELIVAKHRNGATGVVKLAFLNHLTKFANLARGTSTAPRPEAGSPGGSPSPV